MYQCIGIDRVIFESLWKHKKLNDFFPDQVFMPSIPKIVLFKITWLIYQHDLYLTTHQLPRVINKDR